MTTETASQLAVVTATQGDATIGVSQIAIVTPISQVADTITISQVALVSADNEYTLPTFYTPFYIPSIWGSPLWVQN